MSKLAERLALTKKYPVIGRAICGFLCSVLVACSNEPAADGLGEAAMAVSEVRQVRVQPTGAVRPVAAGQEEWPVAVRVRERTLVAEARRVTARAAARARAVPAMRSAPGRRRKP